MASGQWAVGSGQRGKDSDFLSSWFCKVLKVKFNTCKLVQHTRLLPLLAGIIATVREPKSILLHQSHGRFR